MVNNFMWLGLWLSVIIFFSDISQVGTSKGKFLKGGKKQKRNVPILDTAKLKLYKMHNSIQ